MKAKQVAKLMLAAGLLLAAAGSAVAETADGPGEMALRKIMKDLGSNVQAVTDAISREDWQLIEKTAPLIADHPQPPVTEKLRIMAFIGTDMGKFKDYDEEVHKAAESLGQAARSKNGQAVIAAFQTIQTACYGCHRDFRPQFLRHFYGTR